MTKLLIDVECGAKTCLPCYGLPDTSHGFCEYFLRQGRVGTYLKSNGNGDWLRCSACLAAEERANALERRYAELVEDVSRRTDQNAKGKQ
jgi:hypothetical protein